MALNDVLRARGLLFKTIEGNIYSNGELTIREYWDRVEIRNRLGELVIKLSTDSETFWVDLMSFLGSPVVPVDLVARSRHSHIVVYLMFRVNRRVGSLTSNDTYRTIGVYFGGAADSKKEAEVLARQLVRDVHTPTYPILPRVFELDSDGLIADTMRDAEEFFERMSQDINDAEELLKSRANARAEVLAGG